MFALVTIRLGGRSIRATRMSLLSLLWVLAPLGCVGTTYGAETPELWSLAPLQAVPIPDPADDTWSRNPIDRFILARLQDHDRQPALTADPRKLIRRVFLDLIGLPPTPEQLTAELAHHAPHAVNEREYLRLIDQLLASPLHAERWARHWLDVVRYAESDGFKADEFRPHAWRYRDYVVRSFQADKPYDRFLQEQLAGDEMFPGSNQATIATGYLRLWPLEDNQKDVRRQWSFVLNDITEVTGEAMLGLGLRCARCHDHKFDPILQADYYRVQAFFAAIVPQDAVLADESLSQNRAAKWHAVAQELRAEMERFTDPPRASRRPKTISYFPPYVQDIYARDPAQWSPLDRQYARLAEPQIEQKFQDTFKPTAGQKERWKELETRWNQLARWEPEFPVVPSIKDVGPQAPRMYLGGHDQFEAEVIEPGFLSAWDERRPVIVAHSDSTGRRSAFARWLTQPDHPLTSRVYVNRIWQQLMGQGIVATPNDFGHQGAPPTHPRLLDWLAQYFVQHGWSTKQLQRLIVTSSTYRQACESTSSPVPSTTPDPLFGRQTLRRLDAEQIRDAMLVASRELQVELRGPSVSGDSARRSIYVRNVRNQYDELLTCFDSPDMFNSCARRYVTTTPVQALLVLNDQWPVARADAIAQHIARCITSDGDSQQQVARRVQSVYHEIILRDPTDVELEDAIQFVRTSPDPRTVWADLCHVLLCSNEFFFVE